MTTHRYISKTGQWSTTRVIRIWRDQSGSPLTGSYSGAVVSTSSHFPVATESSPLALNPWDSYMLGLSVRTKWPPFFMMSATSS